MLHSHTSSKSTHAGDGGLRGEDLAAGEDEQVPELDLALDGVEELEGDALVDGEGRELDSDERVLPAVDS